MAYDTKFQGYDRLGSQYPALPLASGSLHVKMANNPMSPGLMQRHFEENPYTLTLDVETNMGQNIILGSGTTLPANNPGQFFTPGSLTGQDFTTPRVVPEF